MADAWSATASSHNLVFSYRAILKAHLLLQWRSLPDSGFTWWPWTKSLGMLTWQPPPKHAGTLLRCSSTVPWRFHDGQNQSLAQSPLVCERSNKFHRNFGLPWCHQHSKVAPLQGIQPWVSRWEAGYLCHTQTWREDFPGRCILICKDIWLSHCCLGVQVYTSICSNWIQT